MIDETIAHDAASAARRQSAPADPLLGVIVIIPAYNEQDALPHVLAGLPRVAEVLVVDNASTDRTSYVAREAGATVIYEPQRGYGAACQAGLAELRRRSESGVTSPRVIAFIDGDFSDYPERLPMLLEPIFSGRADLVLGSRLKGHRERGAMPLQSLLGNRLACCLMRWLWGAAYSDLGPFRVVRYPSLLELGMTDRGYGWTIEMQIKAAIAGLRVVEVPVDYRPRIGVSKISGTFSGSVKAGWRILTTIAYYAVCLRGTSARWSRRD